LRESFFVFLGVDVCCGGGGIRTARRVFAPLFLVRILSRKSAGGAGGADDAGGECPKVEADTVVNGVDPSLRNQNDGKRKNDKNDTVL
jgi:hypothetical protein